MELKTEIWVQALMRRAAIGGAFATVARRGDRDAGAVLVKIATLDGRARLYAPALKGEGETVWLNLSAGSLGDAESAVDAYARKRADGDPDLWVVEIEDRHGRNFLTEPIDDRPA
ncbi:MAG: DUF1491 family protein [Alphaproteobacteria bacterium]